MATGVAHAEVPETPFLQTRPSTQSEATVHDPPAERRVPQDFVAPAVKQARPEAQSEVAVQVSPETSCAVHFFVESLQ